MPIVPWQVPVVLFLIIGYGIAQPMMKVLNASPGSGMRKLLLRTFSCFVLVACLALAKGKLVLEWRSEVVFVIGLFNALACLFQFKCIGVALSKNALFTVFDDVIAMTLCFAFLGEAKLVNEWVYIGSLLSLLAFVVLGISELRKSPSDETRAPMSFFLCIACTSVIWGGAMFAERYFAGIQQFHVLSFLSSWYAGTLVGTFGLFCFGVEPNPKARETLSQRDVFFVTIAAIATVGSLACAYWASSLAPQNVIQPIYLFGEMTIPTLIGLFVFKETKGLRGAGWVAFAMGFIGGTLVFLKDVLSPL